MNQLMEKLVKDSPMNDGDLMVVIIIKGEDKVGVGPFCSEEDRNQWIKDHEQEGVIFVKAQLIESYKGRK